MFGTRLVDASAVVTIALLLAGCGENIKSRPFHIRYEVEAKMDLSPEVKTIGVLAIRPEPAQATDQSAHRTDQTELDSTSRSLFSMFAEFAEYHGGMASRGPQVEVEDLTDQMVDLVAQVLTERFQSSQEGGLSRQLKLVDRELLAARIRERKLQSSELVRPGAAKLHSKDLGVDAWIAVAASSRTTITQTEHERVNWMKSAIHQSVELTSYRGVSRDLEVKSSLKLILPDGEIGMSEPNLVCLKDAKKPGQMHARNLGESDLPPRSEEQKKAILRHSKRFIARFAGGELAPEEINLAFVCESKCEPGIKFLLEGRWPQAASVFGQHVTPGKKADIGIAAAIYGRALAIEMMGKPKEAQAVYRDALSQIPDDDGKMEQLGREMCSVAAERVAMAARDHWRIVSDEAAVPAAGAQTSAR